ncbi:unnamed protein product [Heligmosomoides polygyrus]|uniref:LAM_G_DOMAIN domain-containing protein n=1 Tax=Heligmosomoides polygyrus TaxID=6339 RepID=A0A183G3K3_HELPZ|nr:unnamed protein product [Heligmosomoides polygyrus]
MHLAGAFGDVLFVDRGWGIRYSSVPHEHRLRKIQLQSNVPAYTINLGQHSLRLANGYKHDVVSEAKMVQGGCQPPMFTPCLAVA